MKKRIYNDELKEQLTTLYQNGYTIKELAKAQNITEPTIRRWINDWQKQEIIKEEKLNSEFKSFGEDDIDVDEDENLDFQSASQCPDTEQEYEDEDYIDSDKEEFLGYLNSNDDCDKENETEKNQNDEYTYYFENEIAIKKVNSRLMRKLCKLMKKMQAMEVKQTKLKRKGYFLIEKYNMQNIFKAHNELIACNNELQYINFMQENKLNRLEKIESQFFKYWKETKFDAKDLFKEN